MLNETKNDLIEQARKLMRPYESYSIDELADAYCAATDTSNDALMGTYLSALILRFWYQIPKLCNELQMFKKDFQDCYDGVLDAIIQACAPDNRKWQTTSISAEQVINQIISTRFKAATIYEANLQKNAGRHLEVSLDASFMGDDEDSTKTLADTIESDDRIYDYDTDAVITLIQNYINRNKIVEAIVIDNIVFNDVQRHFKKIVKTVNAAGEPYKYTEYSSEFWLYKLIQIVSKLPESYKTSFRSRYTISEEKLNVVLKVIDEANNQKLRKYTKSVLAELKGSYAV